jgi:N-acetylmuramoyl-L-alanine amidase
MEPSHQHRTVLAGLLLLLPACFGAPPKTAVTAVRFWTLNDATRIVIEASGDFEFTSDRVSGPDRIFFDVKGARMRLGGRGPHTVAVGDHLLKQVRIAETQPGVTRVVFDLEGPVDFTASQLTNPNRLIVELRPASRTPLQTAEVRPLTREIPLVHETATVQGRPTSTTPVAYPVAAKTTDAPATITEVARATPTPKITPAPALVRQPVRVQNVPDPTHGREKAANLKPPRPAKLGDGANSMTRVLGLKIGRIVLDAGHGGHDTGTFGPAGLLEKDLVLDVTKRLGTLIESRMGAEVVYTRSDDTFIPLETRTQIANEHKADLFLSIHANSSPARNSSGVETYYLNFATSQSAMEVAARENASSQKTVYELKDLLQKIALQDKVEESREFAARIQQHLYTASMRANSRTRNRGVKKAPFVVLIGASMPSVLAEIGFVSNPKDEVILKRAETRQRIAEGLYKGLSQYAGSLSQFQVASN